MAGGRGLGKEVIQGVGGAFILIVIFVAIGSFVAQAMSPGQAHADNPAAEAAEGAAAEGEAAPAEGAAAEGEAAPAEGEAAPVEGEAAPAEEGAAKEEAAE